MIDKFYVGQRVRLMHDVAPYPLGLFPAGSCGTVVEVYPDVIKTNPVAYVQMDDHFDDLNEWENVLQVFRSTDESSEVTEQVFEAAPPSPSRISIRMPLKD